MSFDLVTFRTLLLVAVFWLLIAPYLRPGRDSHRAAVAIFTAFIGLRYLWWRLFDTVLPFHASTAETFWVWLVFVAELLAFMEVCIFLLIMSRINYRHHEADQYQKDLFRYPSVDIFIPTYNEGLDVLEKTIIGAKHVDYPNFKVWVLDDGKREWLREFCEQQQVGYLTRTNNLHAKAGNLNNGLQMTSGELFAIFDADFVPARNFLRRTIGFFIHNPDIGLVQTPQHFYNRDPIQTNLYLDKVLPDEQRLFFDSMAPCRDRWNAAFCCGSCSIIRREAIDKIGGIPTSSITEDLLTTLCLLTVKFRTVYLNEKLSHGLSADSLKGYFIQRGRWCRGGIQCFFVPEGPLRAKGLSPLQRLLFSPYGWVIQPLTRFMILIIPIIYLWTGLSPLHFTTNEELIGYQFPMFLAFVLAVSWLAKKKYVPILSTAVNIFGMFRLLPVMLSSLIKPFGEPFRVTPKGAGATIGVDWYVLLSSATIMLLTLAGLIINIIPEHRIIPYMDFFPYVLFWSCLNIFILGLCCLMSFDAPRKRKEERFIVNEETTLCGAPAVIVDMSLSGCMIRHFEHHRLIERGTQTEITIPGISGPIKCEIKNSNNDRVAIHFLELLPEQREQLIVKLFTGNYDNEIHETGYWSNIISTLWHRAFGRELH